MKGNKKPKKKARTMDELTQGFEELLKGKELNPKGAELFEKVIKKAATTKPHGLKPSQT